MGVTVVCQQCNIVVTVMGDITLLCCGTCERHDWLSTTLFWMLTPLPPPPPPKKVIRPVEPFQIPYFEAINYSTKLKQGHHPALVLGSLKIPLSGQ
jgi:hypothetical protein